MQPRLPYPFELMELQALWHNKGVKPETILEAICKSNIAVFDSYVSENVNGYVGKVMVLVLYTEPSAIRSYIWVDGKLEQVGKTVEV